MTNSDISENTGAVGGGICNYGTAVLKGGNILGNGAEYGGGIYNVNGGSSYGATLKVTDTIISGNIAYNNGGGIYNEGTLNLKTSTISSNQAGNLGGGIYWENLRPVIWDTTITDNSEPQIYPY